MGFRAPKVCEDPVHAFGRANGRPQGREPFCYALADLARRLAAYPGFAGLLYRSGGDPFEVCIVAPRPMTKPMRLLLSTWAQELRERYPGVEWIFTVVPAPPEDLDSYRCAYWSQD